VWAVRDACVCMVHMVLTCNKHVLTCNKHSPYGTEGTHICFGVPGCLGAYLLKKYGKSPVGLLVLDMAIAVTKSVLVCKLRVCTPCLQSVRFLALLKTQAHHFWVVVLHSFRFTVSRRHGHLES
jgi:hypothetical protein